MISEDTSVDDLFGSSESSDELFDAPSETPTEEAESDFDIDDLFGKTSTPADEAAVNEVAAVEAAADEVAAVENVDEDSAEASVQVVSKKTMPTDGLAKTRSRTWIDNTGVYHVEGRLIEIAADHVRLLKTNGRTCTVPNSRLCEADAAYVNSIRQQSDSSRLAMLTSK